MSVETDSSNRGEEHGGEEHGGEDGLRRFAFIVRREDHGRRIDSFLSRHLRNYTTWRLHRMVRGGCVRVDDQLCEVNQRVFRGQLVQIRLVEPADKLLNPEAVAFEVLYDDPWMMVVDKPAGIVAHPIGEFQSGTLCNGIQNLLNQQTIAAGLLRPGIVHRLDRMTSGLLMIAKSADIHVRLSRKIQDGEIEKQYLALVQGLPKFDELVIDRAIGCVPGNSILMSVAEDSRNPRSAKTGVRVLKRFRSTSLLQCRLFTGRNHQIRVHLASVGHSVLGDEFYQSGNQLPLHSIAARDFSIRHALHASVLQFRHPVLNCDLTVSSSPPSNFWTFESFL